MSASEDTEYGSCVHCGEIVRSNHSFVQTDEGYTHIACLRSIGL